MTLAAFAGALLLAALPVRVESDGCPSSAEVEKALAAIELKTGREIASIPADEFRRHLALTIDLKTFKERVPTADKH